MISGQECPWNLASEGPEDSQGHFPRPVHPSWAVFSLFGVSVALASHSLLSDHPLPFPILMFLMLHQGVQPSREGFSLPLPTLRGICSVCVCASVLTGSSLSGFSCAPGRRSPAGQLYLGYQLVGPRLLDSWPACVLGVLSLCDRLWAWGEAGCKYGDIANSNVSRLQAGYVYEERQGVRGRYMFAVGHRTGSIV